jgi:hypothetical protein
MKASNALTRLLMKLFPDPELWFPDVEEQGKVTFLNSKKYIRCHHQCKPSFGQGDEVPFRWSWLSREDCLDNRRRMGPAVIEGSCPDFNKCWEGREGK